MDKANIDSIPDDVHRIRRSASVRMSLQFLHFSINDLSQEDSRGLHERYNRYKRKDDADGYLLDDVSSHR